MKRAGLPEVYTFALLHALSICDVCSAKKSYGQLMASQEAEQGVLRVFHSHSDLLQTTIRKTNW